MKDFASVSTHRHILARLHLTDLAGQVYGKMLVIRQGQRVCILIRFEIQRTDEHTYEVTMMGSLKALRYYSFHYLTKKVLERRM